MLKKIAISLFIFLIFLLVVDQMNMYATIKRLSNDGWVLHHIDGCGACDKQKKVFGWMLALLPNENCIDSKCGFNTFPTWRNEKRDLTVKGFISRKDLVNL